MSQQMVLNRVFCPTSLLLYIDDIPIERRHFVVCGDYFIAQRSKTAEMLEVFDFDKILTNVHRSWKLCFNPSKCRAMFIWGVLRSRFL